MTDNNELKKRIVDNTLLSYNERIVDEVEKSLLHLNGLSGVYYPHKRDKGGYVELLPIDKFNDIEDNQLPLPPPEYREWYGMKDGIYSDELYLQGGKYQIDFIRKVLHDDGFLFGKDKHIFELGCAGARMLRWFEEEASVCECWGCDVNAETIVWCQQYLSPPFNFFPNTTAPNLPFSDGFFSLIYAGSVFTHIGELADTWLLELRRILDKNGRIFITVFDEVSYSSLLTKFPDAPAVSRLQELNEKTGIFEKPYGKYSYSTTPRQERVGYNRSYLIDKLKLWFNVKGVFDCAYGWQTGILLSKK